MVLSYNVAIMHDGFFVGSSDGKMFDSDDCWLVVGCNDFWKPVKVYGTAFGFSSSYDVILSAVEDYGLSESKVMIFSLYDASTYYKNGGNE